MSSVFSHHLIASRYLPCRNLIPAYASDRAAWDSPAASNPLTIRNPRLNHAKAALSLPALFGHEPTGGGNIVDEELPGLLIRLIGVFEEARHLAGVPQMLEHSGYFLGVEITETSG